jgi:hypothetical protein
VAYRFNQDKKNGRSSPSILPDETIQTGTRDTTLASLAGTMRRKGMSGDAIAAALLIENKQGCEPPLPERQVRKIAQSISRYAPAPVISIPPPASGTADREEDPEGRAEPGREYHPKTGNVMALAPTIGDVLLFHYKLATNDGEKLHVFRDGVYRENGYEFIRKKAQALAEKWNATGQRKTGLAEEVHEWVVL